MVQRTGHPLPSQQALSTLHICIIESHMSLLPHWKEGRNGTTIWNPRYLRELNGFFSFFFYSFFSSHLKSKQVIHFWVPYSAPHQPLLWISLSFMAWHARGTGSTHPGEKWQLFTASCLAHKQQGEASTQVSTCLFQNVSVASMVGKSSDNINNTLYNFLESSLMFTI